MWRLIVVCALGACLLSLGAYRAYALDGVPAGVAESGAVLKGLGRGTQPLTGPWKFHVGDDPAWASPGFDDSAWEQIETGKTWEEQGHHGYTGFAWYRRQLTLGGETSKDFDLALLLSKVDSAAEIYWNGVKVGSYGKVPPKPVWYGWGRTREEVFQLGPATPGVLAIRVWKAPRSFYNEPNEGGLTDVPVAGSPWGLRGVAMTARYERLRKGLLDICVACVCLVVGMLALLIWLRNRGQRMLLWLALAMIFQAARYVLLSSPKVFTFRVAYGLVAVFVAINMIAIWFLLIELLDLKDHKTLVKWTWIFAVIEVVFDTADSSLQLFDWTTWHGNTFLILDTALTIPAIYGELWGLVIVFAAFGKRMDGARWMLAFAALLANLQSAVYDTTGLGMRWTHLTISLKMQEPLFTIAGNPVNAEVIINAFLLIAVLYAAWQSLVEHRERQAALELEMRNARAVQQVMIPDELPRVEGFRIESAYEPAGEVGGDFYQVLPLKRGGALVVIGDVSGKGMPAAMTASLLVGAVRTLTKYTDSPAEILATLNERMMARNQEGFTTCLVVRVDVDGSTSMANAGHLAPYWNGVEFEIENGLPLGIMADVEYAETMLQLEPTDTLMLMSDGVVEARSATGELFGFERTQKIAKEQAEKVVRTAQAFGQKDDITVLTLEFVGAAVASRV